MYFALEPGVGFALNFLVGVSLCFTARLKRTEPRVQLDHQVSKTVWKDAGLAAVSALQSGSNATTILMPSGAGDVQVGLETVRSFVDTTDLPHFRIVVAIPSSLASAAQKLYAETFAEDSVRLVTLGTGVSKHQITSALKQNSSTILLCPYGMMLKFGLAFIESKIKTPMDLIIFATAHILRAGGFHSLGAEMIYFQRSEGFLSQLGICLAWRLELF